MRHLPPTIHQLLEIKAFRVMMKTTPWLPDNLTWGNPWRLWALRNDGTWVTKEYPTYADVWRVGVKAIRSEDFQDVAIVNKRRLTPPSDALLDALLEAGLHGHWCPRCRRPSYFGAFTARHHALKLQPTLTEDEPFRCYYCGIRKAATKGAV